MWDIRLFKSRANFSFHGLFELFQGIKKNRADQIVLFQKWTVIYESNIMNSHPYRNSIVRGSYSVWPSTLTSIQLSRYMDQVYFQEMSR